MDNMAYLQQIAAERPTPPSKPSFTDKLPVVLILKIVAGVFIFLIALMIVVGLTRGDSKKEQFAAERTYLRTANLLQTIEDHQGNLKSSDLRTFTSSLSSILKETLRDTSQNLQSFGFEDFSADTASSSVAAEEKDHIKKLNKTLKNAYLSGNLDRILHREFTLQISLLIAIESDGLARTKDPSLQSSYQKSIKNLENIHTNFSKYRDKTN